jgi:hypothetical protein
MYRLIILLTDMNIALNPLVLAGGVETFVVCCCSS